MPKLKIIHTFRAPLGGLFRHALDVANEQISRGHDVGIICDSTTGGDRADSVFAELGPKLTLGLHRFPMNRNPSLSDLSAVFKIRKICADLKPDVVHGHGSKGGLYARLPAFVEGRKRAVRAYTPHGGSFNYLPGSLLHKLYMQIEGLLEKRTDVFLFESAYIAGRFNAYVGQTNKTVRIVLNGVSDSEFEPIDHKINFDFVYLGELRPAKGIEVLIDALKILVSDKAIDASLLIVGSGPDEAALKERVANMGLSGRVVFEGPGPIRNALSRGRIMTIPSKAESLPYVILEAAAASQPLVSTDVGGIPEIFGPYSTRLVPPNDPNVFAAAMERSIRQTHEARAAEARELSEFVRSRFTLKQMVDGVSAGYVAAITKRSSV
jgi:glycosyltransferase involved in cell wall biosynthesis